MWGGQNLPTPKIPGSALTENNTTFVSQERQISVHRKYALILIFAANFCSSVRVRVDVDHRTSWPNWRALVHSSFAATTRLKTQLCVISYHSFPHLSRDKQ